MHDNFIIPFTGAIPITGGQFSNSAVSVVIGNVECTGDENELLNCSYITDIHEAVSGCDPSETAAVSCQGLCMIMWLMYFIESY